MKKLVYLCLALAISFTSCLKDSGKKTYKVYSPITETTSSIRAKIKSQSAIPVSNAGKLALLGNYVFLNEINKGIHIIDNSNPTNPVNISFINIPGNMDVTVKGNTLYADCFADLVVLDITNPLNITYKTFIDDIYPDRRFINGFTTQPGTVVVDWTVEEKTMDLEIGEGQGIWMNNRYVTNNMWLGGGGVFMSGTGGGPTSSSAGGAVAVTGSMSRFSIINNYLYTVSNSTLNACNISNVWQPTIASKRNIGFNIETIYPFKDKLFIGSQTGMMIYEVSNPANPNYVSGFAHARLCDPVVANDNYAYVTLHSGSNMCQGTRNELNVIDINNITSPVLLERIDLTKPMGLGIDGKALIICDDNAGIRIFDATNGAKPTLKQTINLNGAYDVICNNGIAIVSNKNGIHQYNYTNLNNVHKLSSFNY